MANASFVITVSSPRSVGDLGRFIKDTSEVLDQCKTLQHYFERVTGGLEPGVTSFDIQTSSSAPVRASGTITITYGSAANADTITIGSVTLNAETGTPSGQNQFKLQTDAPTTATNLKNCINAHTTLSLLGVATAASGVVTFTLFTPGKIGNQCVLTSSNGTGWACSGSGYLTSGAGGCELAAQNYSRG